MGKKAEILQVPRIALELAEYIMYNKKQKVGMVKK